MIIGEGGTIAYPQPTLLAINNNTCRSGSAGSLCVVIVAVYALVSLRRRRRAGGPAAAESERMLGVGAQVVRARGRCSARSPRTCPRSAAATRR